MMRLGLAALVGMGLVSLLQAGELKIGTQAPAWTLKGLDGKTIQSSAYDGKVVVLNFWATWCRPCVKEIPDFIEIQKELGGKGLVFVGVSMDTPTDSAKTVKKVQKFVEKTNINYPVVMGNAKVNKDYGSIPGLPHTYIIDKDGKIRMSRKGSISKQALLASVKPLL